MNEAGGNLLTWEKRSKGMYLFVDPRAKGNIDLEKVKADLDDQNIMNYDWNRIKEVITQARGIPELVGPSFKVYNTKKADFLHSLAERFEVKFKIDSSITMYDLKLTMKDIEAKLKSIGVVHGIQWPEVTRILNHRTYDTWFIIARCTAPVDGRDARIEEKVPIDSDAKPIHISGGRVDFKNIKNIRQIKEGEVIAIKRPPTPGKPGIDVYGNKIVPLSGKDLFLNPGTNTKIQPDGVTLVAATGGYLYREDGAVCIGDLLVIPGDVDFHSGNITYSGETVVEGNVLGGFKVEAGKNALINGNVGSSEVTSHRGSITVAKGVFGKNKACLTARRSVYLNMVQDAKIKSGSSVEVKHSLRNCQVWANNIKLGISCIINGCQLTAYNSITAYNLGGSGSGNKLIIQDAELEADKQKIEELKQLEKKYLESAKALEKRLKGMKYIMRKAQGNISPKAMEEMKRVEIQYNNIKEKLEFLEQNQRELLNKKVDPVSYPGKIIIKGQVPVGTKISMYGMPWDATKVMFNMQFTWSQDGVCAGPFKPGEK